jgi:hypothetical protein
LITFATKYPCASRGHFVIAISQQAYIVKTFIQFYNTLHILLVHLSCKLEAPCESTLLWYILDKKMWHFFNTFCIILKVVFFSFHLAFWEMHKMDFKHKTSHTIFVTFQMSVIFQRTFMFSHTHACLVKNFIHIFFVKSHKWNL